MKLPKALFVASLLMGCAAGPSAAAEGRSAVPDGAEVATAPEPGNPGGAGALGSMQLPTMGTTDGASEQPMIEPMETVPAESASLSEVAPGVYRLDLGARALEVDVSQGARVLSFGLDGRNVLRPLDRSSGFLNGGSTLWTSPQSDWAWPPLPAHDEGPYVPTPEGAALSAAGEAADLAGTRIGITKRFSADRARDAIQIEYKLRNEGGAPATLAPWEVSRHPTSGLTFWPGSASRGDFAPEQRGAHLWLSYDALWAGDDGKVFADASAGWLAHLQDDLLVVRSWQDVPAAMQAPEEAEVEVYLAATYIELEAQGPYDVIAPGASAAWSVRWYVVPVPAGTDVAVGSAALIDLVLRTIADP